MGFAIRELDLASGPLGADAADQVAAALLAGDLVEASVSAGEDTARLLAELDGVVTRSPFGRGTLGAQLLVGPRAAAACWYPDPQAGPNPEAGPDPGAGPEPETGPDPGATPAPGEAAERLDLAERPVLGRVLGSALMVAGRLRRPGEEILLSAVPALRRRNTIPRYYHRDSYPPSAYRMVWDMGLENSGDAVNVSYVSTGDVAGPDGEVRPQYRHLFQQHRLPRYPAIGEEEIDRVQRQVSESMLPFPAATRDLRDGAGFVWLDDRFFHTVYVREGRSAAELAHRPRSVLIVRQFAGNSHRGLGFSPAVWDLLGDLR